MATDFENELALFKEKLIAESADGLTITEAAELMSEAVDLAVTEAQALAGTGDDKQKIIVTELGALYDVAIAALPTPYNFVARMAKTTALLVLTGFVRHRTVKAAAAAPPAA